VIPIQDNDVRQHATHERLLRYQAPDAEAQDRPALDAIIVPASRPAHNLDHAITLARAARCQLVILCSRDAHAPEVRALLKARSFACASVIEIPPRYKHDFFKFETTDWIKKKLPGRDSDLSIKRNVGLILARMRGWQRIFFMDDDIRDLDATALAATVSLVSGELAAERYYTAGMSAVEFPDNSVVCHARREIGNFQDVFVSGSALAVDCTVSFAFFPDIYNEDWLFFYRDAAERRLASSGYTATQLSYDPFANPKRAANEEFGDVIAEGLYSLLDQGHTAEYATAPRYWRRFLTARKELLDGIIEKSEKAPDEIQEKMTRAVETARDCLEKIRPDMCVEYVQRWRRDLGRWETTLKGISEAASMPDALARLGLDATGDSTNAASPLCSSAESA